MFKAIENLQKADFCLTTDAINYPFFQTISLFKFDIYRMEIGFECVQARLIH